MYRLGIIKDEIQFIALRPTVILLNLTRKQMQKLKGYQLINSKGMNKKINALISTPADFAIDKLIIFRFFVLRLYL